MTDMATSGQTPPSATLNCPKCQTEITYYDVAGSSYYGCPNCHAFFQYEYEKSPYILTAFSNSASPVVLPIGTEGYLNSQFVRVVGFIHKREAGTTYDWVEYMLFQKDGRYCQLAEYDGHWMFIEPTGKMYQDQANFVQTEERQYKIFSRYKAEVINAVGEFDWNLLNDEQLTISEYIQPPYMVVHEQDQQRSDWYKARYVKRSELATAFGMAEKSLPPSVGVGAIEPSDANQEAWRATWAITGLALVLILVMQVVLMIVRPSKELINQSYDTQPDSAGVSKPIITPSFDVQGPTSLLIDLSANNLTNHWLELSITLMNEKSGRVYEVSKSLEYYEGVESGESWTEGSRTEEAILSRVPSGRYHMNIYPVSEKNQTISYAVRVRQNKGLGSNLVLFVLLLAIYPIIQVFRRSSFESRRWANSNIENEQAE
ncbi:MAG: DUF4178 domain-containing protein [Spirosoma sp.]|nr:DUF4178 domain-containing protein [Spirosoma sp.]OJW76888.1 MAG: DUF4178 domain-containing protein [Spirosoma sp. 48-14]